MIGIVNSERAEQQEQRAAGCSSTRAGLARGSRRGTTTDRNAPTMKMSPWAKLISSMIP